MPLACRADRGVQQDADQGLGSRSRIKDAVPRTNQRCLAHVGTEGHFLPVGFQRRTHAMTAIAVTAKLIR